MSKKRKHIKQHENTSYKLVVCKSPLQYKILDIRTNKPVQVKMLDKPDASMVVQDVDQVQWGGQPASYLSPNNVSILLSIASKSLAEAKKLPRELITSYDTSKPLDIMVANTKVVYDYIERIQTAIVFSYTALEAFANLSIPVKYEYKAEPNNKGIMEIYDQDAIERWISLSTKLSVILPEIYQTKNLTNTKLWNEFKKLEDLRNKIIHQKSIERTEFYRKYFHEDIYTTCNIASEIIKFFFDERQDQISTNPLWPWMVNTNNDFPITYQWQSENFEIIGNLYEGFPKKANSKK